MTLIGLGKEFLYVTSKIWSIGEKNDKLDFIKVKTFALVKGIIREIKGGKHKLGEKAYKSYVW